MGDTVEDVAGRLRKLAVELVRAGKAADAAAVLAGIGAVDMLSMFAEDSAPAAHAGATAGSVSSPGY
jgi:hypothetical protein